MSEAQHLRAICLDAFGTLCRIDNPAHPYVLLFHRLGVNWRQARHLAMTQPVGFAEIVRRLAPDSAIDIRPYAEEVEREVAAIQLFEEAPQVLARLREMGLKTWVISNLAAPLRRSRPAPSAAVLTRGLHPGGQRGGLAAIGPMASPIAGYLLGTAVTLLPGASSWSLAPQYGIMLGVAGELVLGAVRSSLIPFGVKGALPSSEGRHDRPQE